MNVLITGSGGFIGRNLVHKFLRIGSSVTALYRSTMPRQHGREARLALVQHDLSKPLPENTQALDGIDVLIHAASHTHITPNSTMEKYLRSNIEGMKNIIDFAIKKKVKKFIYLSTVSVYGEISNPILTEETPLNRPNLYGASKYLGYLMLEDVARELSSVTMLLPGVVGKNYFTPWLGKITKKALAGEEITYFNGDSLFNNVVDVKEIYRFIQHWLTLSVEGVGKVNLAASEPMQVRQVIELIIERTKSVSCVTEETSQNSSFVIATKVLEEQFQYKPRKTIEIIDAYLSNNLTYESN